MVLTSPSTSPAGILTEPCETAAERCSRDQEVFKGIVMRYLAQLSRAFEDGLYCAYLEQNARTAIESGRVAATGFFWASRGRGRSAGRV